MEVFGVRYSGAQVYRRAVKSAGRTIPLLIRARGAGCVRAATHGAWWRRQRPLWRLFSVRLAQPD